MYITCTGVFRQPNVIQYTMQPYTAILRRAGIHLIHSVHVYSIYVTEVQKTDPNHTLEVSR